MSIGLELSSVLAQEYFFFGLETSAAKPQNLNDSASLAPKNAHQLHFDSLAHCHTLPRG